MEPGTGVGVGIDTRIVGSERFHFVEAVLDWIGLWFVAEMPLAREVRRVTVLLEELGDRRSAFPEEVLVTGGDHNRERRTDGDPSSNERGATGRATSLAVPTREHRALFGEPINIWGRMAEGRAASRITAEIIPAGIILHQHDDVRFLIVRRAGRSHYAEKRSGGYKQRQAVMD